MAKQGDPVYELYDAERDKGFAEQKEIQKSDTVVERSDIDIPKYIRENSVFVGVSDQVKNQFKEIRGDVLNRVGSWVATRLEKQFTEQPPETPATPSETPYETPYETPFEAPYLFPSAEQSGGTKEPSTLKTIVCCPFVTLAFFMSIALLLVLLLLLLVPLLVSVAEIVVYTEFSCTNSRVLEFLLAAGILGLIMTCLCFCEFTKAVLQQFVFRPKKRHIFYALVSFPAAVGAVMILWEGNRFFGCPRSVWSFAIAISFLIIVWAALSLCGILSLTVDFIIGACCPSKTSSQIQQRSKKKKKKKKERKFSL